MPGRKRDPRAQAAALAAAEELLNEVGYHRVTMERIAERSGVAKMTLYRWWPNKAAIVTDAVRGKLAPAELPDTGSLEGDLLAQLEALLGALTRYGDASVVAGAMSSRGEAGRADLRDILHPWFEGLVTILERRGDPSLPVTLIAQSWVGYVVYRVVFLQEEVTREDLSRLIAR
ncbi:TetR/AcrR family transcriptional regulator [Paractinoplanes lichenicola]|uniref:TetR/AcrR family transcriptional regulator n=1 Tax=Paractinoplanes lichenicola TaxID=2802976 RepID=A0ABS1VQ23_9ACTN|nr:TetR/AcrR family transcriptional regulator [Actinoplanes lichenicola]MBL7255631.1 TetR/AcrR family transcriptional regulator [Actinoplanes lichenicola]